MENQHLLAKARELMRRGPTDEELLARSVYGAAGPAGVWVRLLTKLLGPSGEFERDDQGRWRLAENTNAREPLVVATRATRARGGRLLELAAAPAGTLDPVWRWSFLPEGRIRGADELSQVASSAPTFAETLVEVVEVLAGRDLVVLNTADLSALQRELQLAGMPPLGDKVHDLGQALLTGDRKHHRAALRRSYGLPAAAADALTGELQLARAVWLRGRERGGGDAVRAKSRRTLERAAEMLADRPGVYTFRADDGEVLYIGSAARLRRRVMSYFGSRVDRSRDLLGLIEHTSELHALYCGTHLDAVLIEAEEIAAHSPRYNVQRNAKSHATWLRIAGGEGSVVRLTHQPQGDAAVYLGPIENRRLGTALADILQGLWECSRRGGRRSDVWRTEAEGLAALLIDTPEFLRQARRRLHRSASTLTSSDFARLTERIEFVERYAEGGIVAEDGHRESDALVVERAGKSGLLFLSLVRSYRPVAGCRIRSGDTGALQRAVHQLLCVDASPSTCGYEVLVRRWLGMNTAKWVSVSGGESPAAVAHQIEEMLSAPAGEEPVSGPDYRS